MKYTIRLLVFLLAAALIWAAFNLGVSLGRREPLLTEAPKQETVTLVPAPPEPEVPQLTPLQQAMAANPDTVAWLTVPGTDIDEAVVQAQDNDYYLRRDALGREDRWGCTFSDCLNDLSCRRNLHPNSMLYGHSHNSEDPTQPQFTQLFHYLDEDFLRANPAFTVVTVEGQPLTFQVAAVFYTDAFFDYIEPFPEQDYYTTLAAKNLYQFENVTVSPEDRLMTLSTCAYKYDVNHTEEHRFVVVGKLLEEGQAPITPVVAENPSPELPMP